MRDTPFTSILITGASSGIGEGLAHRLAAPGVHMALTGRDAARLQKVSADLTAMGAAVLAETVDVRDIHQMSDFIARADQTAPLDLVIANAGVSGGAGVSAADAALSTGIFEVNVNGVINTVVPAAERMRSRRRGRIAIVSSVAGFRGLPTAPAYSASKVAVRAWGEAIRPHLAADGIGLSMIYPGFVESRITAVNKFKMPLLLSADQAADIIVRDLAAAKRTIAFPWQTALVARALAALPGPIFDAVMRRAPSKND